MRITSIMTLLFCSAGIALATPVFADDRPTSPGFALMDNTGDGSKINLDVTAIVPDDHHEDSVLTRSSLLGQYVGPSGFGGYLGISASHLISDRDTGVGDGLGDAELGGLFHHALSSDADLGVRVGLAIPLANHGNDRLAHVVSTTLARPADLATTFPADAPWLRLGLSPTYHRGAVFLRTDLGVDVALGDVHGGSALGHINFGAGLEHKGFVATAELQTLFDASGDSLQTAGLSVRYQGKWLSPYVAVSTPLEDGLRGDFLGVTAGLTVPF